MDAPGTNHVPGTYLKPCETGKPANWQPKRRPTITTVAFTIQKNVWYTSLPGFFRLKVFHSRLQGQPLRCVCGSYYYFPWQVLRRQPLVAKTLQIVPSQYSPPAFSDGLLESLNQTTIETQPLVFKELRPGVNTAKKLS